MARKPLVNFRLDPDTKADWERSAQEVGESLAEYIRGAVELRRGEEPTRGPILRAETARNVRQVAKDIAEHRRVDTRQAVERMTSGERAGRRGRASTCPREAHHRSQVFCKACGTTPP